MTEGGYRLNVGVVLLNKDNKVFWGRRKGESAWQFPQGGLCEAEDIQSGMFRELNEELGLFPEHVIVLGRTTNWLYYDVPTIYTRGNTDYRGQKQIWYLLKFVGKDHNINIKFHKEQEFDAWRWVDYWLPTREVIYFKQEVYHNALTELACYIKKSDINE